MTPISEETIRAAIAIIGTSGNEDAQIERDVRALVADEMTSRRLIDLIPEAFGIVLVSHISHKIVLPTTFSAKSSSGQWIHFPFSAEPIFADALRIAQSIFHDGPRDVFQNISLRSSMTNTVNNTLNSGASLDGACLSGPALIGIPADIYPSLPKSFWKKLFGG
jgi:hypothetical protein